MMVLLAHQAKGFVKAIFVHVFFPLYRSVIEGGRVVLFSILPLISLCFDQGNQNWQNLSSNDAFHKVINGVAKVYSKLSAVSQLCTYMTQRVHTLCVTSMCFIFPCALWIRGVLTAQALLNSSLTASYCLFIGLANTQATSRRVFFEAAEVFLFGSAKNSLQPIFCVL